MMIKILLSGANGKMGKTVQDAIAHEKDLRLVATVTRGDDLTAAIAKHQPQVVIDFTEPACAFDNTQKIIAANAHPVIGTTGFKDAEIETLQKICKEKKWGAIIAPNFSIGAVLMMQFVKAAAHHFPDAEIIEYHHPHKKDAPSGTARKTAAVIHESMQASHTIPIHSVRLPGIFANQDVIFGAPGETLTIQHCTTDRSAMMPGLFLCCRRVITLDHLVYGMESLI